MASDSRFYQLELSHRPALWGDIGSLLRIEGLVVGGEGTRAVLMLPGHDEAWVVMKAHNLSLEDWTDWLKRSDDPEVLVQGSLEKVFHRKVRYGDISGAVQQKVWKADGFKCMFCGAIFGDAQMTIDHFVPLEMGGVNNTSNYISACRRCNKKKGAMDPKEFCKTTRHGYEFYVQYLAERFIK
jgi:hypothetical protein